MLIDPTLEPLHCPKDHLVILLYHGVTNTESVGIENYSKKHIAASEFRKQMRFVKENCSPVSMEDVVQAYQTNKPLPDRAVAITFDDGFENNYSVAAPILREFDLPATFYITSGIVNTNLMFWVDQLEDCLNLTKKKEIQIALEKPTSFALTTNEDKLQALIEIKAYCKKASRSEKDRIINAVIHETEITPDTSHASNYEKITWDQLREMNEDPNIIIGGHSLYHDILSSHSQPSMQRDVELSLGLLEHNLNTKIEHYSYPEGQEHHFNKNVVEALQNNGITCSPSAIHGINPIKTDLFYLN